MTDETRDVGRPKKTLNDLPEGWKLKMMELADKGASKLECRVRVLGISTDLWARFMKEEREFSETVKDCTGLCQSYWENLGNQLSRGEKEGSAAVWIFNMKNRFGWRDKVEISEADSSENSKPMENVNWDDPIEAEKAWRRSQRMEEPK